MAADAGIFQQYMNPVRSVADYRGDMDKQEQNALTLAAGRLSNQQAQQGIADEQVARQATIAGAGDSKATLNALQKAGLYKHAQAYQKSAFENQEAQGKASKQKVDLIDARLKQSRNYLEMVRTPEQYLQWHEGNHSDPILGPELTSRGITAEQARAQIMEAVKTPEGFQEQLNKSRLGIEKFAEMNKPSVHTQNLGGTSQVISTPGMGGAPTVLSNTPITQSADSVASQATARRGQNMTDVRAREAAQGNDLQFSPDAIINAAARYNIDGTLPPMGMGKTGSHGRTAILNKAAELKSGVSPDDQRYDQLSNKNEVAARGLAIKAYGPNGNEGKSIQAANTGLNHLDTVLELARAQKSGDIQAFNKIARFIGTQTGQAAPTNLNAALVMVAPEITKAVVGAGGGVEDRRHAADALNPNNSPDQIIGAAETMQELFGGRLTEARRTYERTTRKKDFDEVMLSPASLRVIKKSGKSGSHAPAAPASSPAKPGADIHAEADAILRGK